MGLNAGRCDRQLGEMEFLLASAAPRRKMATVCAKLALLIKLSNKNLRGSRAMALRRNFLRKSDHSQSGGTVTEGIPNMTSDGRELTYLGAYVTCPLCGTGGPIVAFGPRLPGSMMGKTAALEGDLVDCGCDRRPSIIASQDVRYQTFETHQLAAMGFTEAGRPIDEKPYWIKFGLNEQGSCEGLRCGAHFEDGSVEYGVFDANNTVKFERSTGSPCRRVEVLFDDAANRGGSIVDSLLSGIKK